MRARAMMVVPLLATAFAACAAPAEPASEASPEAATPSASPTATASAQPTKPQASSPAPSTEAEADVRLGYGARLELEEDTQVREAPAMSGAVVREYEAGDAVIFTMVPPGPEGAGPIFGPVKADELTWYPVEATDEPGVVGWIAVDPDGVEVVAPDCPEVDTVTVADLAALAPQERLACLADRELELTGMMPLSGLGGLVFGTWEPMWLAYPVNDGTPLHDPEEPLNRIGVFFAPGIERPELPPDATEPGQEVRLVGHFDDPASATCTVQAPAAIQPEPIVEVELYCRTHLVVTGIELVEP